MSEIDQKLKIQAGRAVIAASNTGPGGLEGYRQMIDHIFGLVEIDYGLHAVKDLAEMANERANRFD